VKAAFVKAPCIDPRFTPFKLAIRESSIHLRGVYALERIPANRKVIEYGGERIDRREADRRSLKGCAYLFEVDEDCVVDGSVNGSGAEIINHSCEPNLVSRVMKGHIIYMSLREIQPGEELATSYNFSSEDERYPCRCGTRACRGTV